MLSNPNSHVQKHSAALVMATMFLAEHEYWIKPLNTPNITDSRTCKLYTSLASNNIAKEHQPCGTSQDAQRVDGHHATTTVPYAKHHQQGSPTCNASLPHVNIQLTHHADHNP